MIPYSVKLVGPKQSSISLALNKTENRMLESWWIFEIPKSLKHK